MMNVVLISGTRIEVAVGEKEPPQMSEVAQRFLWNSKNLAVLICLMLSTIKLGLHQKRLPTSPTTSPTPFLAPVQPAMNQR